MSIVDECPSFGNQNLEDGQCEACLKNIKRRTLFKACNKETIEKDRRHPAEKQDLPLRYYNELGRMHVIKGRDHSDTKQIISWETVKPCRGERCVAYDMCEYSVRNQEATAKCKVEATYLRSVASIIYRNFITVLDEPTLMRVGMHLMPIYQNLCRLKISEIGIGSPVESDDKGRVFINPVYKEMREHIKLLEQTWRSLGLTEYYVEAEMPDADLEFKDGEAVPLKKKPIKRKGV